MANMPTHVALHHVTRYVYDRAVELGPQVIRLRPAPHFRGRVLSYSLKVEPDHHLIQWQRDAFANYEAHLVFPEKTTEFKVTVDLKVEITPSNAFDVILDPEAGHYPFRYPPQQQIELATCLTAAPAGPLLQAYVDNSVRSQVPTIDFLIGLNRKLYEDIRYRVRREPGVQTPEQTLALQSGSCRDSSWLLVQLLRHLGFAARFVSGYLIQPPPGANASPMPAGTTSEFAELHAWCEVFLPGAGWVGLDPTSGLLTGEIHIPLASAPEPSGTAPIEGRVGLCEVDFSHSIRYDIVQAITE